MGFSSWAIELSYTWGSAYSRMYIINIQGVLLRSAFGYTDLYIWFTCTWYTLASYVIYFIYVGLCFLVPLDVHKYIVNIHVLDIHGLYIWYTHNISGPLLPCTFGHPHLCIWFTCTWCTWASYSTYFTYIYMGLCFLVPTGIHTYIVNVRAILYILAR